MILASLMPLLLSVAASPSISCEAVRAAHPWATRAQSSTPQPAGQPGGVVLHDAPGLVFEALTLAEPHESGASVDFWSSPLVWVAAAVLGNLGLAFGVLLAFRRRQRREQSERTHDD